MLSRKKDNIWLGMYDIVVDVYGPLPNEASFLWMQQVLAKNKLTPEKDHLVDAVNRK